MIDMDSGEIQKIKQRFGIIGHSPLLNHAIKVALQVAQTDMTVLITGESGSGKESFSKIIHQLSSRKHGQFIAVNCGAIPEGTIDSELFGHEKGSFTGAHDARQGYFEVTNGGTIFLDEIGEMPVSTQARLLRVLENGEFLRVGSSKVQKTDVRVVAATNIQLIGMVESGKFREDLYYRLNTVPIYVPPLRERGQDIDLLFRKFAGDFAEKYRVKPITLDESARKVLLNYRFPGNIRQLKNLVDQISVLSTHEKLIGEEELQGYLPSSGQSLPALYTQNRKESENYSERDLLYKVLFDMKKDMTDLKKLVLSLMQGNRGDTDLLKEHENLFRDMDAIPQTPGILLEAHSKSVEPEIRISDKPISDEDEIQDIQHETQEEDLSLENKEKELILRALRKNNNKRKYAAKDLGISERTLYRKIKHYDLEEN